MKFVRFFAAIVAAVAFASAPALADNTQNITEGECSQQYMGVDHTQTAACAKARAEAAASVKDSGNGIGIGAGGAGGNAKTGDQKQVMGGVSNQNDTRVFAPVLPSMVVAALPPLPPGLPGQVVACVPPGKVVREARTFITTGRLGGVYFESAPDPKDGGGLYTEVWYPDGSAPRVEEITVGKQTVDLKWGTIITKTTILSSAAMQGQIMVGGAVSNGALQVGGAGGGAVQDPVDRITVGGTCVLNREEVEFRLRIVPQEMKPVTVTETKSAPTPVVRRVPMSWRAPTHNFCAGVADGQTVTLTGPKGEKITYTCRKHTGTKQMIDPTGGKPLSVTATATATPATKEVMK